MSRLFVIVVSGAVSVSVGLYFGLMGHVLSEETSEESVKEAIIQAVGEGTGVSAPQDKKPPVNAKEIRQTVIEAYGEES